MAGLLHDLDIEHVDGDLKVYALEAERILYEQGVDPEIIDAIKIHDETAAGKMRRTPFQHALAAGEKITGLIIDAIAGTLKKGGRVSLVGFGSFSVVKKAARKDRNPQTDETITINARTVVTF